MTATRRGFLQVGSLSLLGLTLPDILRARETRPVKERQAIFVFLKGGPSHHESFDPKPDARAEIRGEFGAIPTAIPGVAFSALVPQLAAQMKRLTILRAVTHRDGAHEPGVAYLSTGYSFRPGHDFPGVGAVISFERQEAVRRSALPAHVGLPDGREAGYLGPSHHPFAVPGNPNDPSFRVPDLSLSDGLTKARFERRRRLAEQVNADFRRNHPAEVQRAADRFVTQAQEMILSPKAEAAFDLKREDGKTRERYGVTPFGQRLLLARRLIEAGVPFVSASDFEWDDHQGIFPKLKQRLPVVDRGLSALIADLDERGLLASTLVVVLGEFGRTPKVNATQGRDHWPNAFSVLLAGGGVRGGQVVGVSDAEGAYPKDRPVTPEELFHSLYVLLGIDPTRFLPSSSGRDIPIVRDGKFIRELVG